MGNQQSVTSEKMRSNQNSITRSNRSANSTNTTFSAEESVKIKSLHGNLLRKQTKRDPYEIYEVEELLGEGSMGSVTKVKKRDSAIGGSARPDFVRSSSRHGCCGKCLAFLPTKVSALTDSITSHSLGTFSTSSDWGSQSKQDRTSTGSDFSSRGSNPSTFDQKHSNLIRYGNKKDKYYALKSIHLSRCSSKQFQEELKNEIEILKTLDHADIVRAIETFEWKHRLFLVLELCSGGDLYTREPYKEMQAQKIINSLLSAVAYLHSKGVVHRDLKFENIMFVSPQSDEIKLIDFGLSQKFAAGQSLHDAVGTVYSMAPELLAGQYDSKADVWSIGVITFMLLSSSMPFYGKDRAHLIKKIVAGKYHFNTRRWKYVSEEAKLFVTNILKTDPTSRPTADQALHSTWLHSAMDDFESIEFVNRLDSVQAALLAFTGYSKLKKLALLVVAYKSTDEEIGFLKSMFSRFDSLQNGEISLDEFRDALRMYYDYSEEEIKALFRGIDIDGTGTVHYMEFLAATLEAHGSIDEERLAEAFDRLDCDDSGYITVENLRDFLGVDISPEYIDSIIAEADIVNDHRISYEEFLAMWSDDSDEKMRDSKISVQSRKTAGRQSSVISSTSSITSSVLTDDDHITLSERSMPSSPHMETAIQFFKTHKELSIRGP